MNHQKIALLAGAVTLILLVSACSQAVFQADSPAYPTFSLVGAPDRDVTYELRVTGPGMDPITGTGIGPTSGSLTLPVPAGRNRTFELLAENDVYSGVATSSLFAGRENRVRVPMLPGPVFVDARGNRLIQIRDFGSTVETDAEDEIIPGTVRAFFPSEITPDNQTRVMFSSIGELITLSIDSTNDLLVFSDLSTGAQPTTVESITEWSSPTFVTHPTRNSVVIGAAGEPTSLDLSLSEVDIVSGLETQSITVEIQSEWFQADDLGLVPNISLEGIAVDRNDVVWVVLYEEVEEDELILVGISLSSETVVATQTVQTGVIFRWYDGLGGGQPQPPRVDVLAVDSSVLMLLSGTTSAHPPLYRYDSTDGLVSWGTRTEDGEPSPGEFWGPRRFLATRRENEVIVVDQKDRGIQDDIPDGRGRLLRFRFGTTDGWQAFGEEEFDFFDTGFSG